MTKRQAENYSHLTDTLARLGFTHEERESLIRIERTLARWGELECGNGNDSASWAIERAESSCYCTQCGHKGFGPQSHTCHCEKCGDVAPIRTKEKDGKPYLVTHPRTGKPYRRAIPDREAGALKRLAKIMASRPHLLAYHQGDPRGCSLYIVPANAVGPGESINSVYTRGVAICY